MLCPASPRSKPGFSKRGKIRAGGAEPVSPVLSFFVSFVHAARSASKAIMRATLGGPHVRPGPF